jgi:ABC-type sugar transport system permease subunit/outer membrane protein assembly factor BamB
MATAAPNRSAQTARRSQPARLAAGALLLLVLLNLSYLALARPFATALATAPALIGGRVLATAPLAGTRAAVITTNNRLLLLDNAEPVREISLDKTLSALTASPDGRLVAVGTSERALIVYDAELAEQRRLEVNGRVVGLVIANDGSLIVGHAVGQFTGRVWLSSFDATGAARAREQIGVDILSLSRLGDGAAVATVDGRVAAVGLDGASRWALQLPQPAVLLREASDEALFAGDERGSVSRIDADGALAWTQALSAYRIRTLALDTRSHTLIVADDDRQLFVLNPESGQLLYRAAAPAPVRGLLGADAGRVRLLTEAGELLTLDLGAALRAPQPWLNALVLGANLLLLAVALGSTVAAVPAWRSRAGGVGRQLRRSRAAYALLLPAFLLIALFSYVPTLLGLYYSFTNFNLREPLRFIGLANFVKLARDPVFWTGVGNMVLIVGSSLLKNITLPLLVAELVYWLQGSRLKYFFRSAFIIPSIVPGVVGVLLWKMIYDPSIGLINVTLESLGLGSWQRAWLADEQLAIWAIIFAGFPWVSTFAFLVLLGGLLDINPELFDAAAIDGASWWQRFVQIDWRLIGPQLQLVLFFTFVGSIQEYGNVYIFTRGGPGTATYVPGLYMFFQTSGGEFGYAAAIGFVLALIVLIVTVWRFRFNATPADA